ncbi:GntR family transcriptional regulator, partial [Streptomyces anulatus]|nr:GntR family transcriptional regulator [Streptomyces anulatus]
QHAERAAGAHRLRRPDPPGRRTAPGPRVSTSQHGVNIAGARH